MTDYFAADWDEDTTEGEKKAAALVQSYLEGATPDERHVFAAGHNYDDSLGALRLLVDDPALDAGTALLIHWYLGAGWYAQFADRDAVDEYEHDTYDLVRLIEQRYLDGFYGTAEIWFDPAASEGGGSGDYSEITVRRAVPAELVAPSGGERIVDLRPEGYDDGLPLELAEKVYALHGED